jgi:hypothetical protein
VFHFTASDTASKPTDKVRPNEREPANDDVFKASTGYQKKNVLLLERWVTKPPKTTTKYPYPALT